MIINLNYFKTIEEAAVMHQVKEETVRYWIRNRKINSLRIDRTSFIIDEPLLKAHRAQNPDSRADLGNKVPAWEFARKNKIAPRTLYENIIAGSIDAVTVCTKVLIAPDDPAVI